MHKINILYVITKLELGGAQKQLLSLIHYLDKERFSLSLFTAKDGLLLTEAFSITGLKVKTSRFLDRSINPLKDFLALCELYNFIKRNRIDIVHTHSSKAGILGRFAARLAKVRLILHTVHGWSFNDYQFSLLRHFFIWLERLAAHFTKKLIVVSNYDREKGLDNHIGLATNYELIRYGIDYSEFNLTQQDMNPVRKCSAAVLDPELAKRGISTPWQAGAYFSNGIKKELDINDNALLVGMVSCFKPQKAPQDFIKLAFLVKKNIPQTKFILVGDGILRKRIEGLISKFNLQNEVILTGWRRDIHRILSAIDVFVLTSLWEGLPVSVLEAMVSSLPVVATDTGGIREVIIDGQTGFLVAPGDLEELSKKLMSLLKDRNLREELGKTAMDSLGFDFSIQNMVTSSQELYDNIY